MRTGTTLVSKWYSPENCIRRSRTDILLDPLFFLHHTVSVNHGHRIPIHDARFHS